MSLLVVISVILLKETAAKIITCGSERIYKDVSCHKVKISDDLLAVGKRNSSFPKNAIYFIDSSCSGGLNFRQACAVEAAARTHPHRDINVLFVGPVSKSCMKKKPLSDLSKYKNINFNRIHILKYLKNTPVAELASGSLKKSKYPVLHTTDFLKYTTLFRYGGIVIDLGVMVAKPLDALPVNSNWVGRKNSNELGSSLLALSRNTVGRNISRALLRYMKDHYKPGDMRYSNTGVVRDVLRDVCKIKDLNEASENECEGFRIYNETYFYPIPYESRRNYFYNYYDVDFPPETYAYHIWDDIYYDSKKLPNNSLYMHLVQKLCPVVSQYFVD